VGEILGLGLTHYPPLVGRDENMGRDPENDPPRSGLPERYRDPANWPARCAASMATTGVRLRGRAPRLARAPLPRRP